MGTHTQYALYSYAYISIMSTKVNSSIACCDNACFDLYYDACVILQLCTETIHLKYTLIRILSTLAVSLKTWGFYLSCWLVNWYHMILAAWFWTWLTFLCDISYVTKHVSYCNRLVDVHCICVTFCYVFVVRQLILLKRYQT